VTEVTLIYSNHSAHSSSISAILTGPVTDEWMGVPDGKISCVNIVLQYGNIVFQYGVE